MTRASGTPLDIAGNKKYILDISQDKQSLDIMDLNVLSLVRHLEREQHELL